MNIPPRNMEKFEKLLNMIMKFDKVVRYAAVCNNDGKILWQSQREGVENILSADETKNTVKRAVSSWKSRNELTDKVGRGMYAVAAYEKIKRITVPLDNNHMLFVSTDNTSTKDGEYGKTAGMGKIMSIVDFVNSNK